MEIMVALLLFGVGAAILRYAEYLEEKDAAEFKAQLEALNKYSGEEES